MELRGAFTAGSLTRTLAGDRKTVYEKAKDRVASLLRDRTPLALPDLHQKLLFS